MKIVTIAFTLAVLMACSQGRTGLNVSTLNSGADNTAGVVTFEILRGKVLEPYCLKCHVPGGFAEHINLSEYETLLTLINLEDPEGSQLYQSVLTQRMPMGNTKLNEEELAVVLQFIKDGALRSEGVLF